VAATGNALRNCATGIAVSVDADAGAVVIADNLPGGVRSSPWSATPP